MSIEELSFTISHALLNEMYLVSRIHFQEKGYEFLVMDFVNT